MIANAMYNGGNTPFDVYLPVKIQGNEGFSHMSVFYPISGHFAVYVEILKLRVVYPNFFLGTLLFHMVYTLKTPKIQKLERRKGVVPRPSLHAGLLRML